MKALGVLFGKLESEAFEKVLPDGKNGKESTFSLAFAAVHRFLGVEKLVLLMSDGAFPDNFVLPQAETISRPSWTRKSLFEVLSQISAGYDFIYFAWADCPLLDPALASSLAERHMRYGAEYSYADGWPYGFAPELLSHETAGILAKLCENDEAPVDRNALFETIQKDINAFDIETEISPVDLRPYRISFSSDSKRKLLLLSLVMEAGLASANQAEEFIRKKPELFRTLPAFFNIQVSGACPQACSLCPWPVYGAAGGVPVTGRRDFMPKADFAALLDKIIAFAGDGVIDLSLWGELALHPDKMELIEMVISRPALSLVIETSGIGWKEEELKTLANAASAAALRKNHMAPLSWIVSLDAHDPGRYKEVRGSGFPEACLCAKTILSLFPKDSYVQAVRVKGFEDDIENFYRSWSKEGNVIIQKYDDFAGALPKMQASDLSPVKRKPCWHIQRDMNILLDGKVPCCRENLEALKDTGAQVWGNAISGDLSQIWERGLDLYLEHCASAYRGICADCDEYYTYNF